jgi:hypothetical protein
MERKKVKINRTELIKVRCTDEEKQDIKKLASDYGMDVSSFIRGKIFEREVSLINAVEFLSMYKEGVHELKKIGNNINQLARYANYAEKSGQVSPALLEELNRYLQDFIRSQREFADLDRKIINA